MWIKIFLAAALLVSCKCEKAEESLKSGNEALQNETRLGIVRGFEARPHSIRSIAKLILPSRTEVSVKYHCGGTLISAYYVLTAAHCLINKRNAKIILGAHNYEADEDHFIIVEEPEQFIIHGLYRHSAVGNIRAHDIALIALTTYVAEETYIKYAKLPRWRDRNRMYEGAPAMSAGWGNLNDRGRTTKVLMAMRGEIMSLTDCTYYFRTAYRGNLCTMSRERMGTCVGDSGGPLIVEGRQVGIVSYGRSQCELDEPSVFVRIAHYLSWIDEHSDVEIEY